MPLKVNDAREAVVIGLQTRGGQVASEVMIYVSYDQPLDEDQIQQTRTLMETYKILDGVPEMSIKDLLPEAPTVPRKYGRNVPCPCGSGRKNKKCCHISHPIKASVYGALVGRSGAGAA